MKKIFILTFICLSQVSWSDEAIVAIDRGQIYQDIAHDKPKEPRRASILFSASSFKPQSLSLPSRGTGVTEFRSAGTPLIAVEYSSEWARGDVGSLYMKAGAGFQSYERSGMVSNSKSEQSLSLLPLSLGGEFEPKILSRGSFSGFLGTRFKPTLMVANRSALHDGADQMSYTEEVNLGFRFGFISVDGFKDFKLGGEQNLSGWGVRAGFALSMS